MRPLLDSIRALLATLSPVYPVYFVEVPSTATRPYVLLWAGAGAPGLEESVDGVRADIDAQVGVTCVGDTSEAALAVAAKVRTVLAPGGAHAIVSATGWRAVLRLTDSRPVTIDTDVTIPNTNRHPSYGVDLYRIVAIPS